MPQHVAITIFGKVQGVGLRYSAYEQFVELGLTGKAQNMPDGSVQIFTTGDEAAVQKFVEWCQRGPHGGSVERVDVRDLPEPPEPGPAS